MASAGLELQKAIYAAIVSDAAIMEMLGGEKVYDEVPRGAHLPYVTFGQSSLRDWSTGSDEGAEHLLTLHVWSEAAGQREVHEIMGALRGVLHDAPLAVLGHRLVNLRHEFSDALRTEDGETYHGIVRYRAVTEPAP